MNQIFAGEMLALVISVAGNLSLGGFFLSSVLNHSGYQLPTDYGMIIFVLEFFKRPLKRGSAWRSKKRLGPPCLFRSRTYCEIFWPPRHT